MSQGGPARLKGQSTENEGAMHCKGRALGKEHKGEKQKERNCQSIGCTVKWGWLL
jgi:hypothetical protein